MALPLYVVDAFTGDAFGGNPAGVVLGHGDDQWMQRVAAEMKHSETAFVASRADGAFDLRWFTPEVEVDLCGHATLASAHVLYTTGRLAADATAVFHTRSRELRATRSNGAVTLDFPIASAEPTTEIPELFDALGIDPVEFLRTDGDFFLCVIDAADVVRNMQPDFARLRGITTVRGAYVTAPGRDDERYDIVSRCFAPRVGIDEDPVTGSMHCLLIAYWGPRLGRDSLLAYQASARGGALTVEQSGDRARLTGEAVTVLEGELLA